MYALIDADILVFRCGFAAERKEWHLSIPSMDYTHVFEYKREAIDELDKRMGRKNSRVEGEDFDLWPEVNLEPLSHALHNVKISISKILAAVDCNEFDAKLYLSGASNFRNDVAKTRPYKGNRDEKHRPTYEKEIREYMMKNYDCYVSEGEEADDLLGIAATKYGPEGAVIISLDKDLDQVPGFKYNFMYDVRYFVSPEQAIYNFHLQLMTGDPTDNIVGIPGVGKGKGAKFLHGMETEKEQIEEVMRQYQVRCGKEDWVKYLTEMGQLLWIRREPDEMWEPPEQDEAWGEWENEGGLTLEVD